MTKEELITNFLEGKCDAQELALVHALLTENPALLKDYIGEEEWEDFQSTHILPSDISVKIWDGIHNNTASPNNTTSPKVYFPYFRWMSVAAAVLLVIGLSWTFIVKKGKTPMFSAGTVARSKNIFNNTVQKMTVTLSDGSAVELSPNSTLSYAEDFNTAKREVVLNGDATFNIAKDVAKPFSVRSNAVLVTVLGTRFTVKSPESNNDEKVILHEGKVMVKISNSSYRDDKQEYYLNPGDIFVLKNTNKQSRTATADGIVTAPKSASTDSLSVRILRLEKDKDDAYVFNNYPLDVVFDQLQIIYNTKIIYNKAALGNRTFIGRVDKKDSLDHILKSIALLNNFSLHGKGDSIVISN